MRRRGERSPLPGLEAAWRRSRLLPEVVGLAALVAGLVPLLAWQGLERGLDAVTLTLAVPAATGAQALESTLANLRQSAPLVVVETAPSAAIEELWASLHGADAPAPLLIDVRLWPAAALDAAALAHNVGEALPSAVVEVHPTPLPAPWTTWPLMGLWSVLALGLGFRVRRGVRRLLTVQRDALTLLVAFGGKPERIDALVAEPVHRRLTLGAAVGAAAGGVAGLALVLAGHALPWSSLAQHPWWSLAALTLATILLCPLVVRLVARRVLDRRLRLAMA